MFNFKHKTKPNYKLYKCNMFEYAFSIKKKKLNVPQVRLSLN